MRMGSRSRARRGFTLLEILLAALLAGLLLAALYAALYTTLQQTQATRDAVESEDLARGVFNRMSADLTGTLSPLPPKSGGNAAASGGAVATPAPTTPPTPTDPAAAAAGVDPSAITAADPAITEQTTPGATDAATATAADYAFQGGVVGEETRLVIYAGRTPEAFGRGTASGDQVRADQRQIIYWYVEGRGLYRRERPWVTADGVRNNIEADPDAPDSVLLAEEVTGLVFGYSDGISGEWASSWDGTAPGPDGVTPLGPPRAIKVTINFKPPSTRGDAPERQVSQIIAVRSAPGTYTPPLLEAPTDGASESGGATTGSTETSGTGGNSSSGGGMANLSGSGNSGNTSGGTSGKLPSGVTGGSGGTTPSLPSGSGNTPSLPSGKTGGTTPSLPSGGSLPSLPSGTTGGGRTGGTTGGATGGKR